MPAGYPRRLANYYPNFNSILNMRHVTKWAEPLTMGRRGARGAAPRLLPAAQRPPGPVLIEVPVDVFDEEIPSELDYTPAFKARSGPDPAAIAEAAKVLVGAERPVIYAGQGVHYAKAWDELQSARRGLEHPGHHHPRGQERLPGEPPAVARHRWARQSAAGEPFLAEADVIFGIGCSFALTGFGVRMPTGKTIIHATLDPTRPQQGRASEVRADRRRALTLAALCEAHGGSTTGRRPRPAREVAGRASRELREAWLARVDAASSPATETPINPYRVIWELTALVDMREHDHHPRRRQPARPALAVLGSDRRRSPTSAGARPPSWATAWAWPWAPSWPGPDKLCINVWGDAAIGFTGMDFETAVRERIPILSILFNNFSMAIEIPVMPVSAGRSTARPTSPATTPTWPRPSAATASGSPTRPRSSRPSSAASRRPERGQPALLEFITAKEITISSE